MAASTWKSSDTEQSPGRAPMTAIDMSEKLESQNHSSDDEKPTGESEEKDSKESEGSLKDYFVGRPRVQVAAMQANLF